MAKVIDLSPQKLDLKLYAGDGCSIKFTLVDKTGTAVPITGTIKAQIRLKPETTGSPLESFNVTYTDNAHGIFTLDLTGSQTNTLCGGKKFNGYWDVEWTPSGGQPRTLVSGKVECNVDVSR